jgi:hypothetical protein
MMALSAPKLSVLTDGSGRSFVDASEEALMVYENVAARWSALGFSGSPPKLWALED